MTATALSESMQMYLITIARLREGDEPVPLSLLADTLSISPVSVNEMCRKLQDQDLVVYRPYKGATLTEEGDRRACRILRSHRLWEVLLMERLGFGYDDAHAIACQLEHATTGMLADRLDRYLSYPAVNPLGELIPRCDGLPEPPPTLPLTALHAGQRAQVLTCDLTGAPAAYLVEQGLRPGVWLQVAATAPDGMLVQLGARYVSLAHDLVKAIQVQAETSAESVSSWVSLEAAKENGVETSNKIEESIKEKNNKEQDVAERQQGKVKQMTLDRLQVGQRGVVVHVGSIGSVRRRMMDMGMVPGSEVRVKRVAPLGDPIEFEVKGYSLSLRKSEAKAIQVQVNESD